MMQPLPPVPFAAGSVRVRFVPKYGAAQMVALSGAVPSCRRLAGGGEGEADGTAPIMAIKNPICEYIESLGLSTELARQNLFRGREAAILSTMFARKLWKHTVLSHPHVSHSFVRSVH